MTRPKKWYLQSANNSDISESASDPVQLVLFNKEGPIKKPNALHSLGNVKNVCHPDAGKYPDDYIMFHCERGRIALPTKAYEWNKSVIKERCSSVEAFITMINQLINGRDQSVPVHESSASSSESTDLLSSVHSAHPSSESTLLPQTVLQSPQSTSQSPLMLTQVVSQSPQAASQQSPSALPQVVSQSPLEMHR